MSTSTNPSQKTGMDTPPSETTRVTWSIHEFLRTAEINPDAMPPMTAIRVAVNVNSSVAGK